LKKLFTPATGAVSLS